MSPGRDACVWCVCGRGRLSGGSPLRCAPPDLEPLAAAAERTHPTPRSPRRARSHVYLRGRAGATRTVSDHNLVPELDALPELAEQTVELRRGAAPLSASPAAHNDHARPRPAPRALRGAPATAAQPHLEWRCQKKGHQAWLVHNAIDARLTDYKHRLPPQDPPRPPWDHGLCWVRRAQGIK